ncbi:hypothetical protein [Ileibacterium valens]|uniref:hypothetical protein n=1 Tax=Ileibacterium valens TaxID=1862668 RepID=UPI003F73E373
MGERVHWHCIWVYPVSCGQAGQQERSCSFIGTAAPKQKNQRNINDDHYYIVIGTKHGNCSSIEWICFIRTHIYSCNHISSLAVQYHDLDGEFGSFPSSLDNLNNE